MARAVDGWRLMQTLGAGAGVELDEESELVCVEHRLALGARMDLAKLAEEEAPARHHRALDAVEIGLRFRQIRGQRGRWRLLRGLVRRRR